MPTPHIRDLNLPDWPEVPEGATIPAGTRYFCTYPDGDATISTPISEVRADYRAPGARYFTADPIPDPLEAEIEAEANRLYWRAVASLDRDKEN